MMKAYTILKNQNEFEVATPEEFKKMNYEEIEKHLKSLPDAHTTTNIYNDCYERTTRIVFKQSRESKEIILIEYSILREYKKGYTNFGFVKLEEDAITTKIKLTIEKDFDYNGREIIINDTIDGFVL